MCTVFLDQGEFCEKCADANQSEAFVSSQSDSLNKPEPESVHAEPDLPPTREERKKDADRVYIWAGVGGSTAMLFGAMLIYAFPNLFADQAQVAAWAEEQRLEDCRLVFEEITYVLRSGDIVRVDHPNPGLYGLSEIYVTNESHQVFLVGKS